MCVSYVTWVSAWHFFENACALTQAFHRLCGATRHKQQKSTYTNFVAAFELLNSFDTADKMCLCMSFVFSCAQSFLAVPALRYFKVNRDNANIERRNRRRAQFALMLKKGGPDMEVFSLYINIYTYIYMLAGWRRAIRCLQLQVNFRKRATNCRAKEPLIVWLFCRT